MEKALDRFISIRLTIHMMCAGVPVKASGKHIPNSTDCAWIGRGVMGDVYIATRKLANLVSVVGR